LVNLHSTSYFVYDHTTTNHIAGILEEYQVSSRSDQQLLGVLKEVRGIEHKQKNVDAAHIQVAL
jgi:hypothetical protein